jgi:hypothetical protein
MRSKEQKHKVIDNKKERMKGGVRTSLSSVPMMDCPFLRIKDSLAAVTLYKVSEILKCKHMNTLTKRSLNESMDLVLVIKKVNKRTHKPRCTKILIVNSSQF